MLENEQDVYIWIRANELGWVHELLKLNHKIELDENRKTLVNKSAREGIKKQKGRNGQKC